jgi:23S rRNA pseudouridine2605 synthase
MPAPRRPARKPFATPKPPSLPPRRAAAPAERGERPRPPVGVDDGLERLQKVLAAAGLGSRRACEELITTGRVEVDRQVVTQLGTRVDPHAQEIRVDGERLPNPKRVVYMLNKPVGVVTTNVDPAGRPRVVDLVPGDQRLFAIGRLDRMSEGLILVTNDGGLANLLAHPRYGVEKKYLVQVAGVPSEELLDRLRRGVRLAEGEVHAKRVSIRSQHKQSAVLEMILDEGKNREIRRMLASLGHKVHQLKRVAVGGLSLGNLLPSQWRPLAWSEIETLRRDAIAAVGPDAERMPAKPGRPMRSGRPVGRGGPRGGRPGKPSGAGRPAGRPRRDEAGQGGRPAPRKRKRPGKASTWRGRPAGGGEP